VRAALAILVGLSLALAACARSGPSGSLPYQIGRPEKAGTPVTVRNSIWRDLKLVTVSCEWRSPDGKMAGVSETTWIKMPWYASKTAHFPPPASGARLATCKTSYTR
jgi:hypothetical protein